MPFYVVVEGKRTEKRVFKEWIPALQPGLAFVDHPSKLAPNTFTIVSGNGYPGYFRIVRDAAVDVSNNPQFGTLVISVDAEDVPPDDKRAEVLGVVQAVAPALEPIVIVQNCCIESWALGSRRMVRRFPNSAEHHTWKAHYDVWELDPEAMPAAPALRLNKAQTAFAYLVSAIRDRSPALSYSKSRPNVLSDPAYLRQLQQRAQDTEHLQSFGEFCAIFT